MFSHGFKEIISYNNDNYSAVYNCMLDALKPYDKVNFENFSQYYFSKISQQL